MNSKTQNSTDDPPTPKDFEKFITWFCLKLNSSRNILFKKIIKDDNSCKRKSSKLKDRRRSSGSKRSETSVKTSPLRKGEIECPPEAILITVTYNNRNSLIEMSIASPTVVPKEIFQALYVCLPYHIELNKFTIRRVNSMVICEINKFLTLSYITELCLDGSFVPEGSYYILLSSNKLKILSLRRCSINDLVCEKIADNLNVNSSSLLMLCLASNRITDVGIKAIGKALRINRNLLHLDVSNNRITDSGAIYLFNQLTEFKLNSDEVVAYKKKKGRYLIKKYNAFNVYDERLKLDEDKENICNNTMTEYSSIKKNIELENVATTENDISNGFDKSDVIYKDGEFYALGNLKLCSLNLAYNNIGYLALHKICNVLLYQNNLRNSRNGGLLRVVLNGNKGRFSDILEEINDYLVEAVDEAANNIFLVKIKKHR